MDVLAKPKESHSVEKLFWATKYEVVSPYTVEQCIAQLNALTTNDKNKHSPFWNIIDFEFDSFHDNGGVVQYGILANTGRLAINGKAVVQLIYQSENNTLVRVRIGLTKWPTLLALMMLAMINIINFSGDSVSNAIAIAIDIIFLVVQTSSCITLKTGLRKIISEALATSKTPRPTTLPI